MLLSDFKIAIRIALRAKFVLYVLFGAIFMATCALLASEFSGRQPATIGLDVGISVIRIVLPVISSLIIQEVLSKELDRKYFLSSLTYPRPRHLFLFGRVLSVITLLLITLLVFGLSLALLVEWISEKYAQATPPSVGLPYIITLAFITFDTITLIAVGTLISVCASTPSFVLVGTFGFMLIARTFSPIIDLISQNSSLVGDAETYSSALYAIGYFFPDLAALDVRAISLYDKISLLPSDWEVRLTGIIAYSVFLFSASIWVINRKQPA